MATELWIEERRGGVLEAAHQVAAVFTDATGTVLHRIGDDPECTWRSAAKPFQLAVSTRFARAIPLEVEDLAVGASSHSAQPEHVQRVQALMGRFGLGLDALYCGAHWPIHAESAHALAASGQRATALHNNCSGKHTFMAAACQAQGWPADYRDPSHPLQIAIRDEVAACSGVVPSAVVDGCGVPCWVLPLSAMARAWATLAVAEGRLGDIRDAMAAYPWWMSGTDREDGDLVRTAKEPLVLKVGARGLMCGALPARGMGFALKVLTGDDNARAVATWVVLEHLFPDLTDASTALPWTQVSNVVGRVVGERIAVWR